MVAFCDNIPVICAYNLISFLFGVSVGASLVTIVTKFTEKNK